MSDQELKKFPGYEWIIVDERMLGGTPSIKGTRLPVELILNCLASAMTAEQIDEDYGNFPKECIPDVLRFAAELARNFKNNVAA
jgi:uncharacterized protein (DUF433 family)